MSHKNYRDRYGVMNTRKYCEDQGWDVGTWLVSNEWLARRKITGFGQSIVVMRYKGAGEYVVYDFPKDIKAEGENS